jgi:hypothetical protein
MNLENVFYVLAIIFMILQIAIMIGLVIAILIIKKKIDQIHAQIQDKIDSVAALTSKPAQVAYKIGGSLASILSKFVKK